MQFPESWLREFCNPPLSTDQLADVLTMAGLEVEGLEPVAPLLSGVVVGHITAVSKHPNADRLNVCTVDVGSQDLLTIVCGASNARVGLKAPCALVGASLPASDGAENSSITIKKGKLRGVESQGMLCSARELGVGQAQAGLMELDASCVPGTDIKDVLGLNDHVFTLKLTPNLAHCLSVYGIAREVSALTGSPLNTPVTVPTAVETDVTLPVSVEVQRLCGRFAGRVMENVDISATTPEWMVERLARCGQRSVNALVDISNYVMFEMGQPTHIFDLDRIHGGLHVRWAVPGEQLTLLNGKTIELAGNVGVITDDMKVESLAGIMGGLDTSVTDGTRRIYVESAFWFPEAVVGRSRAYNFATDAGHRFERGVDPSRTVVALERVCELIRAICGGKSGPVTDLCPDVPVNPAVKLRVSRLCKVIGMPVSRDDCAGILQRLGMQVSVDGDTLEVLPPPHRFDIRIEEDLIEEVVRLVGYNQLPHTPPKAAALSKLKPEKLVDGYAVRRLMAALGYQETINFSFVNHASETDLCGNTQPIELLNPIASHLSVMRSSLLGSLLNVAKFNQDRKAARVCVFEIGRVFLRDETVADSVSTVAGFAQPLRLAALAMGPKWDRAWSDSGEGYDFFDAKGHVEQLLGALKPTFSRGEHPAFHPGRCASVSVAGKPIGFVGELHPKWVQSWGFTKAPVLFELDYKTLVERQVPAFASFSKQQWVERDISVWVPEPVQHADAMRVIHATPHQNTLKDAVLFDIYRPNAAENGTVKEKSFAIRLFFHQDDGGLVDKDVDTSVLAIADHLSRELGARLRD